MGLRRDGSASSSTSTTPDRTIGGDGAVRAATIGTVIRNACIHLNGEQPLLADLFDLPASSDVDVALHEPAQHERQAPGLR